MIKRRIKKEVKIGIVLFLALVVGVILFVNYQNKIHSLPYKLKKLGYQKEEISVIQKLDKEKQKEILNREYNSHIVPFLEETYFLWKNMDRYLAYKEKNEAKNYTEIVGLVNVNRDRDYYTEVVDANVDLGDAVLVNKYYALKSDYDAGNIEEISLQYAFEGNRIKDYVYDAYIDMWNAAKREGYHLIINSSYRDYESQKETYDDYKASRGVEYADQYAARPGHSEHQTGLSIDVASYPVNYDDFEDTEVYQWLLKNSYRYGFILRYPEGKEELTGYAFESWHYRYLGVDLAKKVHDSGLTYDEYYAFYLDK